MQYQKPFLKELALLISANAAANGARELQWSVSFPSAFSPNEVSRYRRVWEELCTDLTDLTGLNQALNNKAGEGGLQTEAVAFASYFRQLPEPPDGSYLMSGCWRWHNGYLDLARQQVDSPGFSALRRPRYQLTAATPQAFVPQITIPPKPNC
jgi:hypothetical protein